jgi:hypothetical protein
MADMFFPSPQVESTRNANVRRVNAANMCVSERANTFAAGAAPSKRVDVFSRLLRPGHAGSRGPHD